MRYKLDELSRSVGQFYPDWMEDSDIEKDAELIRTKRTYQDYRDYGGILDQLSYYEVLSNIREMVMSRRRRQYEYHKKVKEARKSIDFPNLFGGIKGIGRDTNGNKVITITSNHGGAFSIQTLGNLDYTHRSISSLKDIDDNALWNIEQEVSEYISRFGTDRQKMILPRTFR